MSDLTDMMLSAQYERGLNFLDDNSQPTQTEVGYWINDALKVTAQLICSRMLVTGAWSQGRFDKLLKLTKTETVNIGLGVSWCALPSSPMAFCSAVVIADYTPAAVYLASQRSLREVFQRKSGISQVDLTSPIFAFANGRIEIAPDWNDELDALIYHFIRIPTDLAIGGTEDFELDDEFMPLVMLYMNGMMWLQNAANVGLGLQYLSDYLQGIDKAVGALAETPAPRGV